MAHEQADQATGLVKIISADNPFIMDKVDYVYATYAQFMVNSLDIRIAIGDRMPPDGHVKPILGITLPHEVAKSFLKAMSENVAKIDVLLEQMNQKRGQERNDGSGEDQSGT
jgi:hypothetical protein